MLALLTVGGAAAEPRRLVLLQELVRVEAMERKTVVLFPLTQQGAQDEAPAGRQAISVPAATFFRSRC